MNCGVGLRHGSDPALLWLWCRLAATAPIRPLAWEPPYTTGAALEKAKRQKKKKKKKKCHELLPLQLLNLFFLFTSTPVVYGSSQARV